MRSKPIHLSQSELHQLVHYDQGTGVFTSLVARGCVKVGQVLGFIGVDRYCYIDISGRRYKKGTQRSTKHLAQVPGFAFSGLTPTWQKASS